MEAFIIENFPMLYMGYLYKKKRAKNNTSRVALTAGLIVWMGRNCA